MRKNERDEERENGGNERDEERENAGNHERGAAWRTGRAMRRRDPAREQYATAFERVRLVRAWIAAAAALVAVISAYVTVIEHVLR